MIISRQNRDLNCSKNNAERTISQYKEKSNTNG